MKKLPKIAFWAFALLGWVFAIHFGNTPAGEVSFNSSAQYSSQYDPGGQKVVAWNEGKYEIWPEGYERVTPYYGPVTMAFFPGLKSCQDVWIGEYNINGHHCYGGLDGGYSARRDELPSAAEQVLAKGRELAERHWGLKIARR